MARSNGNWVWFLRHEINSASTTTAQVPRQLPQEFLQSSISHLSNHSGLVKWKRNYIFSSIDISHLHIIILSPRLSYIISSQFCINAASLLIRFRVKGKKARIVIPRNRYVIIATRILLRFICHSLTSE